LGSFLEAIEQAVLGLNSSLYITYLRKKGVTVGEGTRFFGTRSIDLTRPCLVEIGRNCVFAYGVRVVSHGFDWSVLREKYGEVLGSTGKVIIEDNVFVGINAIILKGVRIGRNSIIGVGSVVTHNIPPNSVAAGNPCRVIMTIDEYFERRKKSYVEEAKAYALELYRKTKKVPRKEDFWDEFPIFLERSGKLESWVKEQLGSSLPLFLESKPIYLSFEEFLIAAGIPSSDIKRARR
jgi:acetyltransferase-like isoleucine patch superfamily enzyme